MEPPINLETTCPQCGAKLRIKGRTGNEMKADDRVFCPVHGDVGSLDEALRIAIAKGLHARWPIVDTEVSTYSR
jgi:hypothetical protein